MVVLALETVTPAGSYAVWGPAGLTSRQGDAGVPHAVRLPGVLADVLAEANLSISDVTRVSAIAGPGSFTGVRIGLAAAQGLAQTRGWTMALVPTLDALAAGWLAHHPGESRPIVACLDGARGEVFTQLFMVGERGLAAHEPAQVSVPEAAHVPAGAVVIGDGAVRYAAHWQGEGRLVSDAVEPLAATAARLAARPDWPTVAPHAVQPVYVRPPDVELAKARRNRAEATGQ